MLARFLHILLLTVLALPSYGQRFFQYNRPDIDFVFFDPNLKQYIPHMVRTYERGRALHDNIWGGYNQGKTVLYVTDWADDGNGGVGAIPYTTIFIGMAPLNNSFYVSPSIERYHHLFNHEWTHVVMTDKATKSDNGWRKFFGTKVAVDNRYPLTELWSYMSAPRWYAPRWYHEGISCFLETWLGGGIGRALGGYDEMKFRSDVLSDARLHSVVGLETEGSTQDFQVGAVAYLYGTRFVNYLALTYGFQKVTEFYNRTSGSHRRITSQFKHTFGKSLQQVWREWQQYEKEHQKENLDAIAQYPLTQTQPLSDKPFGSMSNFCYDRGRGKLYTAVNHRGTMAKVIEIDLNTKKQRKLMNVDGPMLYQTTYIALDTTNQRLFAATQNSDMRGLVEYNLKTGRKHVLKSFTRMSNLVYDHNRNRLYGIISSSGVNHLGYYDCSKGEITKKDNHNILYSFRFGQTVSDLAVSHDGTKLSLTVSGEKGEQTLALFNVDNLDKGTFGYAELLTLDDSNLSGFSFSEDDKKLYGSSYYTGVSNLWSIDLNDFQVKGDMEQCHLLSNVQTGLFSPLEIGKDTLAALQYSSEGLTPVILPIKEIHDCNAITMLGQKVYESTPKLYEGLCELTDSSKVQIAYKDVYDNVKPYRPLRSLRFAGAVPDISGFRDQTSSFHEITPVLGYRFFFKDMAGLNNLNVHLGISPWSGNKWKNKFHVSLDWSYMGWKLNANWNKSNFYDLVGPLLTSRKGYSVSLEYKMDYTLRRPRVWGWSANISTFGDLDKLPLYQTIEVEDGITSFQTASASIYYNRVRSSLGAVVEEQGYKLSLNGYTYFADKKFYPSLTAQADFGALMPFIGKNTNVWLRTAVGQNFGSSQSAFGKEYFGGFRNNYIDYQPAFRYRTVNAFPGANIDEISAHSYVRAMAELNLSPLRLRNVGTATFYPTYLQLSLFSTALCADPWGVGTREWHTNIGAQLNTELVLLSYLKTVLSVGYAYEFGRKGQWMFSLKF